MQTPTMTPDILLGHLPLIVPELILAVGAMAIVLLGAFIGDKGSRIVTWACVATMVGAGFAAVVGLPAERVLLFGGAIAVDAFAAYAKFIISLTAAAALLLSVDYLAERGIERPEYPVLATLSVLGMYVMVSANDLLALFMGVELQSLCLYVLAAYARDDAKSSEAGLKYFVLSALSSGLLLYGASLVYGFTGSINFGVIAQVVEAGGRNVGLIFGLVFILCGLAFKMSAAPFHMWTPDVYEGAPTAATAFFAAAPKVAATVLFARVCYEAFGPMVDDWRPIVSIMAVLSMAIGALFALQQTNLKRLLAYSSIANMGYALVAIASGSVHGPQALLVFVSIYAITSIGLFGVVLSMRDSSGLRVDTVADLSGLSRTNPPVALALTVLVFSVMGIPPLGGFFGKFAVIQAAVAGGVMHLAILLILASVVSAFYYLRLMKSVWFDEPIHELTGGGDATALTLSGATILLAALTVLIGVVATAAGVAGAVFQ
jgi:NADH-quinone oxidoreductase subunit N